jgi:hypothetical protein
MSAFICSDKHIATVASHVFSLDPKAAQRFADELKRENIRSVNCRYNERTRFKPVDMTQSAHAEYTMADAVRLLECLDYQSCECYDYDQTRIACAQGLLIARGANLTMAKPGLWSI